MPVTFGRAATLCCLALVSVLAAAPARADLVLSELIVDLQAGKQIRDDVEIWNDSPDRAFVAIDPREIVDPSLPSQSARRDPDPEKLGMLVTPARMILEPGERKLMRIAAIAPDTGRERVYRVTVKPVAGDLHSDASGLKVLVGYDLLVLVRPAIARPELVASRNGRSLKFENRGNVSVEVVDGRQCAADRGQCTSLPGKRIYAGATWTVALPSDGPAEYVLKSPGHADRRVF